MKAKKLGASLARVCRSERETLKSLHETLTEFDAPSSLLELINVNAFILNGIIELLNEDPVKNHKVVKMTYSIAQRVHNEVKSQTERFMCKVRENSV